MTTERQLGISKKEQYSNTHQLILEAAAIIFWCRGFEETTIDQIVQLARLSKGAFFHHFKNKDELGARLLDEARNRWVCAMEQTVATDGTITSGVLQKVFEQEKLVFQDPIVRGGLTILALANQQKDGRALSEKAREFLEDRQSFYQRTFGQRDKSLGLILGYYLAGVLNRALVLRDVKVYFDGIDKLHTASSKILPLKFF